MNKNKKNKVSDYKLKEVKKLAELIDSNNTLMLASIKSLPAKNFQKIKKKLAEKAIIKIVKKRLIIKAIESSKKESIKNLMPHLKEDTAVILSNVDLFELASILNESKSSVKAKAGQKSDKDIEIEAGITEIPAGPAVSEFGGAGIQVKVTGGKIEVLKSKAVVKSGEVITQEIASLLGKLDISPFSVGFIPIVAFDSKSNKIFADLIIDKKELLLELRNSFMKSRVLALNLGYISKDIIGLLLAKALCEEQYLDKFLKKSENDHVNSMEVKE